MDLKENVSAGWKTHTKNADVFLAAEYDCLMLKKEDIVRLVAKSGMRW